MNCGTVFGLNCDGSGYALLHVFDQSGSDGIWPYARVIEGTDGLLYGTTYDGGTYGINVGGTVFRLSKDGSGFAVLHNLNGAGGEGCRPQGPVLEASDGMLYGTTSAGDGRSYAGTVFKVGKDGTAFEVLHEFGKDKGDGSSPTSGLVEGWGMALYGTTAAGGINDLGVLFKLNKNGSNYRILHQFAANENRYISPGPLSFGKDHAFYLTTRFGGDVNYGSLLRLSPPQLDKMIITPADSNQLRFTGSGGQTYQILSSTDLNRWSILQTFTMPETGTYIYFLSSGTQTENCFYRATWVP